MLTNKTLKKAIIIGLGIYGLLIIYSIIKSYVTLGDIIKASIIGVAVTTLNAVYEILFKKDLQEKIQHIQLRIKEKLK